jgi:hypothetical protein
MRRALGGCSLCHALLDVIALCSLSALQVADDQYRAGYMQLAPGTVLLKDTSAPYDASSSSLRSFSGTPCEGANMLPGSTHVAVGFTDLGELAAAISRWGTTESGQLAAFPLEFDEGRPDAAAVQAEMTGLILQLEWILRCEKPLGPAFDQRIMEANGAHAVLQVMQCVQKVNAGIIPGSDGSDGNSNGNGRGAGSWEQAVAVAGTAGRPLRWVGYEASAYAVAKAEVLLEMLRQGADTDAVLQVGLLVVPLPASLSAPLGAVERSGGGCGSPACLTRTHLLPLLTPVDHHRRRHSFIHSLIHCPYQDGRAGKGWLRAATCMRTWSAHASGTLLLTMRQVQMRLRRACTHGCRSVAPCSVCS